MQINHKYLIRIIYFANIKTVTVYKVTVRDKVVQIKIFC